MLEMTIRCMRFCYRLLEVALGSENRRPRPTMFWTHGFFCSNFICSDKTFAVVYLIVVHLRIQLELSVHLSGTIGTATGRQKVGSRGLCMSLGYLRGRLQAGPQVAGLAPPRQGCSTASELPAAVVNSAAASCRPRYDVPDGLSCSLGSHLSESIFGEYPDVLVHTAVPDRNRKLPIIHLGFESASEHLKLCF